jgi:hypothetical protein
VLAFWVFPVFVGHLRSCMSTSQRLHLSFQWQRVEEHGGVQENKTQQDKLESLTKAGTY